MSIDRKRIFNQIADLKLELKVLDVTPEYVSMEKLDDDEYLLSYLDALREQVSTRRKWLGTDKNEKQRTKAK